MAPKAKQGSTALKQGTLSFASSKRGAPATVTGKANAKASPGTVSKPSTVSFKPTVSSRRVSQESTGSSSIQSASDHDDAAVAAAGRAAKRMKISSNAAGSGGARSAGAGNRSKSLDDDASSEDELVIREDLDVLEKSGRLNKVYGAARERMGNLKPIHGENQTKAHQILRIFDNSYEFGPCVGVTRMERWERAHALGMNPPTEIRDILLSEQAMKEDSLKQSVYYGEV